MQNRISKIIIFIFVIFYIASYGSFSYNSSNFDIANSHINDIHLTEYETEIIKSLPELVVMVDDNFTPLSFYDSKNSKYSGASVELFMNIAKELGIKYTLNYNNQITWVDKLELIKDKKIDILLPVSITNSRQLFGYFSLPYYTMYYSVIERLDNSNGISSIDELRDKKVGIVSGSTIADFIEDVVPSNLIKYYSSDRKMYRALDKKDIDYGFQNENVFTEDFYKYELFNLAKTYLIVELPKEYCFFFKKEDDMEVLANVISKAISNTNFTELLQKYKYGEVLLLSKYMKQKRNQNIMAIIIALTTILLSILIIFYIRNKNQSKRIKLEAAINEMAYLQSQIKPHFLFNTLNAIMSFCYIDPDKAMELLNSLSKYLRIIFNTNNKNELITIEEEMELIKSYVNIEKARYGDRLITKFEVSEECLSYKIMPLIVQPLIENAIRHNIIKKDDIIILKLTIVKKQDFIEVIIEDNGVGISDEKISNIISGKKGDYGIGIANINKRLKDSKVKRMIIESDEDKGTKVILKLPVY